METMKNNLKKHMRWIIMTMILILIPMFAGMIMWGKLPERLPIHFNLAGEVDGASSKPFAVFAVPLYCLAMQIIVILACSADPKISHGKAISDKIYRLILFIIPATSIYAAIMIYGAALGRSVNVPMISQLFLAIIFLCLGNYIPKVRQNYTVGARLPWTLENPEIWAKTNRLSGWLLMWGGIVFLLNAFLEVGGTIGLMILLIGQMIVFAVIPTIYSYILYKKMRGADDDKE